MNSLPDPTYFLQLSETFIKTARLDGGEEKPRLNSLREISAAELATQPNPILQIAREGQAPPIPVATTLSLGETTFHSEHFDQIGFSTLTEFIGESGSENLGGYELGVFERSSGMPAPTASVDSLELIFCGFNSKAIPELSDAFPNLDAEATSITLSSLDQIRFIKSQCKDGEQILLIDIANEKTFLFLIGADGLAGIHSVDIGRQRLYETMAEVLHLHYIGSAIKLFTRSGFDSSEIAPTLGDRFGNAIQSVLADAHWEPARVHVAGLVHAQAWFQLAILQRVGSPAFVVDQNRLPFDVDASCGEISSMDTEILAKVYSSLKSDEDPSWSIDYLGCLSKSNTIPRREPNTSNPPFPTAHPERVFAAVSPETPEPEELESPPEEPAPVPEETSPYAPPAQEDPPDAIPAAAQPVSEEKREASPEIEAIPEHLLSDIEEYEGEFEDVDDYGGGTGRLVLKLVLFVLSVAIIVVLVTVVFFPKASEKYLGIRPPHVDFEDRNPQNLRDVLRENENRDASPAELSDTEVALGVQDLRDERQEAAFGGLYLPTNPSGATVIIGDMQPQLSPIKLPNVEPGTYDITIMKDGYETQTLTVTIAPKQVLKTDTIVLDRLP